MTSEISDKDNYENTMTCDNLTREADKPKLDNVPEKRTGHENLIPINQRSSDEVREMGAKGGIKSGEVRREQASAKKIYEMILKQKPTDTIVQKIHDQLPDIPAEEITMKVAAQFSIIQQALKGNYKAWENIQSTIGEKPKDSLEIEYVPTFNFGTRGKDESDTNS